jgi:hypothetical protein
MNNACDNDDNCFDHIIGSAAEVERLWSIARYILTTSRTRLEPILFEALLFLRANCVLWDERTVQAAIHAAQKDDKDEWLAKATGQAPSSMALTKVFKPASDLSILKKVAP